MSITLDRVITRVNLEDIQYHVQHYLQRVEAGETVIILKAGQPVAEIKPISPDVPRRPYGLCAGEFITPDDFDAPLPETFLQEFEGQ